MGQIAETGSVYAFYIDALGRYGTLQVIDICNGSICYILLSYLGEEVPPADILTELVPFYKNSYNNRHRMVKKITDSLSVPDNYIFIGKCPPVADNSDGAWFDSGWTQGTEYIFEERWDLAGKDARRNYKKYINNGGFASIKGRLFKNNTACLDNELYGLFGENASLSAFPCLTSADICGYSPKLKNLIKTSPLLHSLKLHKPEAQVVDLEGTGLYNIETDITGVKKLILPKEIFSLVLNGSLQDQLEIYGNPGSHYKGIVLRISLENASLSGIICKNLITRELWVDYVKELDTGILAEHFPSIKKLYLSGCPGIITNIHKMENLQYLQSVSFYDIFGYNDTDIKVLGKLKELREIDFSSVPRTAGKYVKEHWKDRISSLSVEKLRGSRWLAGNIDNPFCGWDGSRFVPAPAYKKALRCYKDTKKLLSEARNWQQAAEAARQYTKTFNQLNGKYGQFIETGERDDIFEAARQLYKECIVITLEEIWNIIEETRDGW